VLPQLARAVSDTNASANDGVISRQEDYCCLKHQLYWVSDAEKTSECATPTQACYDYLQARPAVDPDNLRITSTDTYSDVTYNYQVVTDKLGIHFRSHIGTSHHALHVVSQKYGGSSGLFAFQTFLDWPLPITDPCDADGAYQISAVTTAVDDQTLHIKKGNVGSYWPAPYVSSSNQDVNISIL